MRWFAGHALLPSGLARDVVFEAEGGRFTSVAAGAAPGGARWLPGVVLPGFANAHSHAFHRALRGRTQANGGTFWTWREAMYQVAARLDPDSYLALARAAYAEMALAGVTTVGEFHYLHHAPGGVRYADPNAMGEALRQAAADAGVRLTLLDTCYLAGGLSADGQPEPLSGPQLRFGDGDARRWADRVEALAPDAHGMLAPHARGGAAIHSVRAVPPGQMQPVVAWTERHGAPLHAHLSEQRAENEACQAAYGASPAGVLCEAGALGPRSTMVHATHLTPSDVELLGGCRACACFCPTTEADLADGIGPARALASAGSPLSVGSDSHAVVDLFAEARGIELTQRLATGQRGQFSAGELARAATAAGHACLGWPEAGEIVPGAYADLVTLPLDSPRLAGGAGGPLAALFAAGTAADVRHVVASGMDVVRDGHHLLVEDVPGSLAAAVGAVLG